MWDSGTLTATIDDRGVVTATLNRPEISNALSYEMISRLVGLFERSAPDTGIRVLCLKANGRNFCTGMDMSAKPAEADGANPPGIPELIHAIDHLRVPLVALVQGACVGVGAGMAACADLVIASPDAFFAVPEVRRGIPPQLMLPYLAAAIGARRAARYALTGERLTAQTALSLGLVDEIADTANFADAAAPLIDALMHGGPGALAETKSIITAMRTGRFEPQPHDAKAFDTDEVREGIAAFAAKRPPRWYKAAAATN